jgi:hypothetical protein
MIIGIFLPFVFIKILGASFIFNIFSGEFLFLDFYHEFLTQRYPQRLSQNSPLPAPPVIACVQNRYEVRLSYIIL